MNIVRKRVGGLLTIIVCLLLTACAGAPSVKVAGSQQDTSRMAGPASRVLLMALYPEEDLQTRVVMENAVVNAFRQSGVDASAGYREFESYSGLENDVAELKDRMRAGGFDALVIVDPIRITHHDPGEWASRRSAYRALGMDTSASINLIGQLSEQAAAAKAEIDVLVWDRGSESFVWHTEYDLNAPHSYDIEVARQYADEFGKMIADSLRTDGLVQ